MRQRVVIAMALACGPRLLIADEPTTALDVTVQKQILDLLAGLVADLGMAMVLVSHDLGAVAGRTDRVQVMYAGRTVESGRTGDVFARPVHPYTAALLGSIPRIEYPPHTLLRSIEGNPPDMTNPPSGCRFAPRCSRAVEGCTAEVPALVPSAAAVDREVACFLPLDDFTRAEATDPEMELTDGR
jgi:peptide/nickel transport system ATP-binding protein